MPRKEVGSRIELEGGIAMNGVVKIGSIIAVALGFVALPLAAQHGGGLGAGLGGVGMGSAGAAVGGATVGAAGDVHGAAAVAADPMSRGNIALRNRQLAREQMKVRNTLEQTSQLSARLQQLVGATSSSQLQADATGYGNLGEFVAAAHLYHNLQLSSAGVSWSQFSQAVLAHGLGKAAQQFASSSSLNGNAAAAMNASAGSVNAGVAGTGNADAAANASGSGVAATAGSGVGSSSGLDVRRLLKTSRQQAKTDLRDATPAALKLQSTLQQNSNLAARLEPLVGAGSSAALQADAEGFTNLGEFVAAAHLYHNFGLEGSGVSWATFSQTVLQSGLGAAARQYAGSASAKASAGANASAGAALKAARRQAKADLNASASAGSTASIGN
jgi:hypothetical protein